MKKKVSTVEVLKSVRKTIVDDNYGKKNIEYLRNSSFEAKHFTMIENNNGYSDVKPNFDSMKRTSKMLLRRRSIGR